MLTMEVNQLVMHFLRCVYLRVRSNVSFTQSQMALWLVRRDVGKSTNQDNGCEAFQILEYGKQQGSQMMLQAV